MKNINPDKNLYKFNKLKALKKFKTLNQFIYLKKNKFKKPD